MAHARQQDQWNHTAQLLAMIYNAHRDPKARLVRPVEFHPLAPPKRPPPKTRDLSILRQMFVRE
ncbi:MAG: hypothetical protein NUV77_19595 [Thermoguttaceae bacterium]|nr:hypothetical protein [Thermoguttaceae bacterium]